MKNEPQAMRDVFIETLCQRMKKNKKIFFLSADFGSPKLDRLRFEHKDRFLNVGIAEQNLINVATGLALEGFSVYAYGLAPFISMRAYEQIRVNISLQSQLREININLISVGAGLSYEVSGPTHHCLEDITILRALPGLMFFSPSDWVLAQKLVDFSIKVKKPKYLRFDAKPLPPVCFAKEKIDLNQGFRVLKEGAKLCLVSTGYFTHTAMKVAELLGEEGIAVSVIDVFKLKPFASGLFQQAIKKFNFIVTLEEGFINKGGLDSIVAEIIGTKQRGIELIRLGFNDAYVFDIGNRQQLHKTVNLDQLSILKRVKKILKKSNNQE